MFAFVFNSRTWEAEVAQIAHTIDAFLERVLLVTPSVAYVVERRSAVRPPIVRGSLEPSTCIAPPQRTVMFSMNSGSRSMAASVTSKVSLVSPVRLVDLTR